MKCKKNKDVYMVLTIDGKKIKSKPFSLLIKDNLSLCKTVMGICFVCEKHVYLTINENGSGKSDYCIIDWNTLSRQSVDMVTNHLLSQYVHHECFNGIFPSFLNKQDILNMFDRRGVKESK